MIDPHAPGGITLGRYTLVEPLGGGPTGQVFRAKIYGVAGFERQFAVKRFHSSLVADKTAADRIAAAARAYAAIEHPRIARLHEYGVSEGTHYVAAELVAGLDLARLVGHGERLPVGAAMNILSQTARALAYARGRGIIHGGLCPTNVLINPEGEVRITDFGFLRARLGRRPADDATLAARLPYLAPEQLGGETAATATDVWALGVLLFEVLTGERAFAGGSNAAIAERIHSGVIATADLPVVLAPLLRQALAVKASERLPDASAFADELDAIQQRGHIPGGRTEISEAVRVSQARASELAAAQASGAMSFPLPAPPPSVHSTTLEQVFPGGVPKALTGELEAPSPPQIVARRERSATATALVPPLPPPSHIIVEKQVPLATEDLLELDPDETVEIHVPLAPEQAAAPAKKRTSLLGPLLGILVLAGLGVGGYFAYDHFFVDPPHTPLPQPRAARLSSAAVTPLKPTPSVIADAGTQAALPPADAAALATAATPDAAVAAVAPVPPPAAGDKLSVTSQPAGALVFLDGALKGKTPLTLPATQDRHKLTLVLAGHKLHRAEISGGSPVSVTLDRAEKPSGPAGIKVVCKSVARVYITVDGVDTGMLCPTDRIHVELGAHTIDAYDPVTDTSASSKVDVKETHHSVRVKLDL
jgi:eukaryotic-like serine/threonine-protein kinase